MREETTQEKKNRIFEIYKKDLEKMGEDNGQIRMIVIEYLCRFPKLDPFKMAKILMNNGYNIVFDDSTITKAENEAKRRKVEKFAI